MQFYDYFTSPYRYQPRVYIPHYVIVPPKQEPMVISITFKDLSLFGILTREAAKAADSPAGPPPTTIISALEYSPYKG